MCNKLYLLQRVPQAGRSMVRHVINGWAMRWRRHVLKQLPCVLA